MKRRRLRHRGLVALCLAPLLGGVGPTAAAPATAPSVHPPRQITAEVDAVSDFALSGDGRHLAYAMGRGRFRDLWLGSADPDVVLLPRQLTTDPGDESAPAFSPDGRYLAYVGTGYDAKGDIYLLDLQADPTTAPRRLTGRDTADGNPAFSPDGQTLYYQRSTASEPSHLAALAWSTREPRPNTVDTGGTARAPAPAPDGHRLAFVSDRDGSAGDLYLLDLRDGTTRQLTRGPQLDASPAWSGDGRSLLFSRRALDTDRDGALGPTDRAVLCRLSPGRGDTDGHPLTAATHSATRPQLPRDPQAKHVVFLTARGGARNVWSLPLTGEIAALGSAEEQLALARQLKTNPAVAPHLAVLAYARVGELFPRDGKIAARAALEQGRLYLDLGFPAAARRAYRQAEDHTTAAAGQAPAEAAAARLALTQLTARDAWRAAVGAEAQSTQLTAARRQLTAVATDYPTLLEVQAAAEIAQARLLLDLGTGAAALLEATTILDAVADRYGARPELAATVAEALLLRADSYARAGQAALVAPAYRELLQRFPHQHTVAEQAVRRLLDLGSAQLASAEERIAFLRRLAEDNRHTLPQLAAGALNRIGDLRYADDQWAGAKDAYRQVLAEFADSGRAAAAARLALAEILYREERFRQALDLYQSELQERLPADRIYRLAHRGYIRKSLEAAEFLFRNGEVLSAQALFRDLARYDDSVVEAHRGIIKSAAALGELDGVLVEYRQRLEATPEHPLHLYTLGLCLTYRDTRDALLQARELIRRAIAGRGAVEYFHQTLGYIYEVLETVHGEPGQLELAAESYRRALFLNDPRDNPGNTANLLLNLGNAHFLLGQHATALRHYQQRAERKVPFANPETEILFYRRFGSAAFHSYEPKATVAAFEKALSLLRSHAEPKQAARLCDRLQQNVVERYLGAETGPGVADLAARQADLRGQLFAVNQIQVSAVPSKPWQEFRRGMEQLLAAQEQILQQVVEQLRQSKPPAATRARQDLELQLARARAALRTPERLAELETELLDRLGLAYQEAGRWNEAVTAFTESVRRNRQLGLLGNLARARRSAAYNLYQGAGETGGERRVELLRQARQGFEETLELLQAHGVAAPPAEESDALVGIAVQVPLDTASATQAAFGFSAEQETRLAEAFLTRIAVELGELGTAQTALQRQLDRYPAGAPVPPGDVYGVSLLHHRAGLLAFVRGIPGAAFDHFAHSAELTAQLGNAASTAVNAADMARALVAHLGQPGAGTGALEAFARLERTDRRATALLRSDPTVSRQPAAVVYHAAMAAHWIALAAQTRQLGAETAGARVELQVAQVRALQRAVGHGNQGLAQLPDTTATEQDRTSRADRARAARLHLALASAAANLGDPPQTVLQHLEQALQQARAGLLPELQWRALAALGRHQEALVALRHTSPLRGHAKPGEIPILFDPWVQQLLEAEAIEEAFALMEELAELERVQRLAPALLDALQDPHSTQRALLVRSYPRLLRVEEMRRTAAAAAGEAAAYLERQIAREEQLLAAQLGPQREHALQLARYAPNLADKDALLTLLGLACHAEQLAEAAVAASAPDERASLASRATALHGHFRERLAAQLADGYGNGVLGTLGPRPAEIMEVVESLDTGEVLARVWDSGTAAPAANRWIALVLGADDFAVATAATPAALVEEIVAAGAELKAQAITLAHEDLTPFLDAPPGVFLALSASHWLRSRAARQPFRRSLLLLGTPAASAALADLLSPGENGYRITRLAPGQRIEAARAALGAAHTIALPQAAIAGSRVPTRTGEHALLQPALPLELGFPLPTASLLGATPRAALAVFAELPREQLYATAHLLGLAGVASAALPRSGAGGDVAGFLQRYLNQAAAAAGTEDWLLLGDRGLSPADASTLARERFGTYVQLAQRARARQSFTAALGHAEDALAVVTENADLARHQAELLHFAREVAYASGAVARASALAGELVVELQHARPDSEAHADALLRHGLLLARREEYRRAVPVLEEAVEMLANLELGAEAVQALADMGVVLEQATEYDRALESFATAADFSRDLEREDLLARQQQNIGRLYDLRLSRWAQAKQHYLQALELFDTAGDLGGVIQALLDVGRCERLLGNFTAAAERYALALELLEEEPDPILGAKVVIEQANNAWFQGRYQEAFALQQQVLTTARAEQWELGEVLARNTAGLTWWTLGDNPRALRELEAALARARQLPNRSDEVATSLNNIGLVHREAGRYQQALETLQQALAIDRELELRWAIAYDLRNIGLTLLRQGDPAASLDYLQEATQTAAAIGDQVNQAKALLALAEAHAALGKPAAAGNGFRAALELSRSMALRETQWRALHGLAQLHLATGEQQSARALLFEAVAVVEGMRAAIKLEQLRDGFLNNKLDLYQLLVRVLVDLGEEDEAFAVAERSRSRNFIDLLGSQRLTLRGAVEQAAYDRQQQLKARIAEQETLIAQADDAVERSVYRQALQELVDEQRDHLLQLQVEQPELAALVSVEPIRSNQVQGLLDPGVVLLAYYLLPDQVLCWVLEADAVHLVRAALDRVELGEEIFAYRRRTQNLEPLETLSQTLHRRLLQPVSAAVPAALAPGTQLGIIPHGPLHYLSFATLNDGQDYLVDRHPLFYLPSASVLRYTLGRRQQRPNRKVLALGNPDLGTSSLALPFAEQEVGTIRWNFPEVTELTGDRATESWVVRHLGEYGIIHLASHGEFDPINPLFSALKLAQDQGGDGNLRADEVFALEINADLVVLSACQTGLGRVTAGDDVIGLNRAFFYAGTHAIVSSLWRVSDVSTAVLMKQFYRQYARRDKAQSLRAAMLHVKNRYPHPGYWGAFTLSGDYQ